MRRRWPAGSGDLDFIRLDAAAFAACPNISLDYAVAERTSRAAVVPADLGWSDVGSWGALWELGEKDERGNVAVGDVMLEGAENCYVRSDGMRDGRGRAGGRRRGGHRRTRCWRCTATARRTSRRSSSG